MRRPMAWMARVFDAHRIVSTVLIVVLVASPGFFAISRNFNDDNARQAQNDIDVGYVSCLRGNDNKTVLASVVKIAYDSGTTLDFTKVPSFANLDPATKQFFSDLRDLTARQPNQQTDPNSSRNQALAKLTLRDCAREFPHHTPGLTVESTAVQATGTPKP